jgi:hypothetical protein
MKSSEEAKRNLMNAVKGSPYIVVLPDGMRRNIALLFERPDGVIFFDVFWYGATSHPYHFISGRVKEKEVNGEVLWQIKETEFMKLKEDMGGENPFELFDERDAWDRFLGLDVGKKATRELAEKILRNDGWLK